MRYEVKTVKLAKDHPLWPNKDVYKIFDSKYQYTSMTCYTNEDVANTTVSSLNEGIGWIT